MSRRHAEVVEASFETPHRPVHWNGEETPVWRSNGGAFRGHPARTLPFSVHFEIPRMPGTIVAVRLTGVFATCCGKNEEASGTMGASLQLGEDRSPLLRHEFLNGLHYTDATALDAVSRMLGDGTTVETLGHVTLDGNKVRVDRLRILVPEGPRPTNAVFRDLSSPASFVLFKVEFEFSEAASCPFKAAGGGIPISELSAVVRLRDRARLDLAIRQMEAAVRATGDLEEAKGEALTFLAVLTAATIELGASREAHRFQLEAARALDPLEDSAAVAYEARIRAELVCAPLFDLRDAPSAAAIDRALEYVRQYYAKPLSDAEVARHAGLSTSHFRHLFRETTGHPFRRYLMNLRLEQARRLLSEGSLSVAEVATAVGFAGLPHFSRAFVQKFSITPSRVRRLSE